MKKQKKKHTPEFKARIAFEAIQGIKTQNEIAREYEIHPITVSKWKNELLNRMPEIFATEDPNKGKTVDRDKENLQRKVGQLTMEVDFLEKKCEQLGIPVKGRRS
jgi:transposase-like protein